MNGVSPPLSLCPVYWSAAVRRPMIGQQHAILSIHRVFTYPGAKKFGRFLAIAQVALLVGKSRDFPLALRRLWKCGGRGRTDAADGRVRV